MNVTTKPVNPALVVQIFRAFRSVDDVTLKNNPRSPLSSTISISKTLSLEKLNLSNL